MSKVRASALAKELGITSPFQEALLGKDVATPGAPRRCSSPTW